MKKDALFSKDRTHRFFLLREWDENKPKIQFIGLNPSTANENEDDPTIRRVIRFAQDWGYGGVYMTNLFTFVTAYPKELKIGDDYIAEANYWLGEISKKSSDIIFAWGNFKEAEIRSIAIIHKFPHAKCLGKNKNGTPKHPLYIAANTQPVIFNPK